MCPQGCCSFVCGASLVFSQHGKGALQEHGRAKRGSLSFSEAGEALVNSKLLIQLHWERVNDDETLEASALYEARCALGRLSTCIPEQNHAQRAGGPSS